MKKWKLKKWKRALSKLSKILHLHRARYYQKARSQGTQERWQMIEPVLFGARSLLDVGCDVGVLTTAAAEAGLFALGIDGNYESIVEARRNCKANCSVAFMHFLATPESIHALPVCDVVLCLSVYQHWHKRYGHEAAQAMLKTLGAKAKKKLFFEPASRAQRYGSAPPPFITNDRDSIIAYTTEMLSALFAGLENVEYLGPSAGFGNEPYRYLFMVNTEKLPMIGNCNGERKGEGEVTQEASRKETIIRGMAQCLSG